MKKINILIINGTQATKEKVGMKFGKSNTDFVLNLIQDKLKMEFSDCTFENIRLVEQNIMPCNSCVICCVPGGKCPLQDMAGDDMDVIIGKMLAADVILFGSPVYCMEIPSVAKNFFDRMAQYFHLPILMGKPSFSCITYNLSDKIAQLYLSTALKMLGTQYVGNLSANVLGDYTGKLLIDNEEEFGNKLDTILNTLRKVIDKELSIEPSEYDMEIFESVKKRWMNNKKYTKMAYSYWKEHGLLDGSYYY